eukprot:SAG11_NODE_3125_length_2668_cov_2.885948_3_plen_307_part_00
MRWTPTGGGEIEFPELLSWWRKQKISKKALVAMDGIQAVQTEANPLVAGGGVGAGGLVAEWALGAAALVDASPAQRAGRVDVAGVEALLALLGAEKHALMAAVERVGKAELLLTVVKDVGYGSDAQGNAEVKAIWDMVDADGSGSLDELEMREVLAQLGQTISEAKFMKMFAALDKGGSGSIQYPDFAAWCMKQERRKANKAGKARTPRKLTPKAEEDAEMRKMKAIWVRADKDNSGRLDGDEVRQVMRSLGKDVDDAAFGEAMAVMDGSGDGEVDFAEFSAWVMQQDPTARAQLELLNQLDFDNL